jgi:hypothetical protein
MMSYQATRLQDIEDLEGGRYTRDDHEQEAASTPVMPGFTHDQDRRASREGSF